MASTAALEIIIQLKGAADAAKQLHEVGEQGGFMHNALSFATGGLIGKGIDAIGGSIGGLLEGMIGGNAQMESYNTQFEVLTGSMDNAKKMMTDLQTMGAKTPFEFTDLAQGTQTLLAFGVAQKDIIPDLQMLGDISGGNKEKLKSLSLVFGQVASNGKLMGGDLLQMINAGFNPLNEISKKTGKSMAQLREEMSKGEISYDMVKDAMQAATSEGGQFNGMMDKQSQTFSGLMSTLQDNFGQALRTFGAPIFDKFKDGLATLVTFLSSPGVQDAITSLATALSEGIGKAVEFVGGAINTIWPIIQPFIDAWVTFFSQISSGGDVLSSLGTLFSNFGQAVSDAWGVIGPALGELIGKLFTWIGEQIPGLVTKLGEWGLALWQWIVDTMPTMLQKLGELIGGILAWIGENGPGILAKLGEWSVVFFTWVINDLLPNLLTWLGQVITGIWNWIVENGPTILAKLWEWTQAFFNWIMTDVLPQLPGWLGSLINAVWTFIVDNGPTILAKLWEWTQAFFDWVMTDVVPKIPGWLANIATALWTWVTDTAGDLLDKLINEWVPGLWNWITGPGGVIETIGGKLEQIWIGIKDWVGTTAAKILDKAKEIGTNLAEGVGKGFKDQWPSVTTGILGAFGGQSFSIMEKVKEKIKSKSPSQVWADEIGAPMAQGVLVGWMAEWPAIAEKVGVSVGTLADLIGTKLGSIADTVAATAKRVGEDVGTLADLVGVKMGTIADTLSSASQGLGGTLVIIAGMVEGAWDAAWGYAQERARQIQELYDRYNNPQPTGAGPGDTQSGGNNPGGGSGGRQVYGATHMGGIVGGGARGGGSGGLSIGTVIINAYPGTDGAFVASRFIEGLEEQLGLAVRTRRPGLGVT
jgi:tape measure domain-containing protein